LMMSFQYLGGIVRLGLSSFMSFKGDKRLTLVLWGGNAVAPCRRTLPYSAKSRR
jgi:hypothetical protein